MSITQRAVQGVRPVGPMGPRPYPQRRPQSQWRERDILMDWAALRMGFDMEEARNREVLSPGLDEIATRRCTNCGDKAACSSWITYAEGNLSEGFPTCPIRKILLHIRDEMYATMTPEDRAELQTR